jgi:lipopolysaccharide export system protein LptA
MIATGNVMLAQPGRRGTGDKLVYTAADGNYILTGTLNKPPHATDTQHGTTTGAALVFRGGDDSVEVMSNDAEGNTRRTVTDTRTPK